LRLAILSFISLALFLLDMTLIPFFSAWGAYGSLLFTFGSIFSVQGDFDDAFTMALLTGFLQDIFFPYAFGMNMLINLVIFLGLSKIGTTLKEGRHSAEVLFTTGGALLKSLLMFSLLTLFGFGANSSSIPVAGIHTLIFALLMHGSIVSLRRVPYMKKEWKF
jgi:rod shape-determining protein MreD